MPLLGEVMSAVSEDCWSAGWMQGTEYVVPALCGHALKSSHRQRWAQGELGIGTARIMQAIADKLGHWANLDEQGIGYVPFDPFPTPEACSAELDYWKRKKKQDYRRG